MIFDFKRRCTKLFVVLLAAVLLCGLTGCDSNISVLDGSSIVFEPVPVPEDGWTAESLAKTIRINGKELPEPFTAKNLGSGYKIGATSTNGGGGYLRYKNRDIAFVAFSDDAEGNKNGREIKHMALNDPSAAGMITFNGIGLGSSIDEVKNNLGDFIDPFSENVGFYYSNNIWDETLPEKNEYDTTWILSVDFDSSGKVEFIWFNF